MSIIDGVNWNNYPNEKKQIKLKYLELLKERFTRERFDLRKKLTKWALGEFPHLKRPIVQFAGAFGHSKIGFFIKEHGFAVTKKAIKEESAKIKMSPIEYIDTLIELVNQDKVMSKSRNSAARQVLP